MNTAIILLIQITVFALMLVVGLDCTGPAMRSDLRRWRLWGLVTLLQFTVVPVGIALLFRQLSVPGEVLPVLILIICCPSGSISNTYTFLARGSTSLSVTLTLASLIGSLVGTPLALRLVHESALVPIGDAIQVPVRPLIEQLVLTLLLPVALGLVLRKRFSQWIEPCMGRLRLLSLALLTLLIFLIETASSRSLWTEVVRLFPFAMLLTLSLGAIGALLARAMRCSLYDTLAVAFELPCRNLAIVGLIGLAVLKNPDITLLAAALFLAQAILLLGASFLAGCLRSLCIRTS